MDRWFWLSVAGFAGSLLLGAVAVTGELLHWWGDLGLILGIISLLGTVAFGFAASTRFQVERLGTKIDGVGTKVDSVGTKVDTVGDKVGHVREAVDRVEANTHETVELLRDIRDRLPLRPGA